MTEENKEKQCKCCLGLGALVLIVGVILGLLGSNGFSLVPILAIVVGAAIMLCGIKGNKFCKCCNK